MSAEKKLNACPNCNGKTTFVPIGVKEIKGKSQAFLGRYKCSECGWQSELQEPVQSAKNSKEKNPVYMRSHYFKEGKTLYVWVYTTEKMVESSESGYENLDRHSIDR